jgi:predicted alpha/beta hydrolase family esterase
MSHTTPQRPLDAASILVIPGRGGSSPEHWQSHFERQHATARRVMQDDWDNVDLDSWAQRIAHDSRESARPVLAVAHSFGCLALARAIHAHGARVCAALLVAPADPQRFGIDAALIARPLPCASLLIASSNDPWLSAVKAGALARHWQSRFLNLGRVGHINVEAGFGAWPGAEIYAELVWREGRQAGRGFSNRRVPEAAAA